MIAYTVLITLPRAELRDGYVAWLRDEHVREVMDAGALDGEILLHEETTLVEVRYHFANRDAFTEYELTHAQRLRQRAFDKFTYTGECTFVRRVADVHMHSTRG